MNTYPLSKPSRCEDARFQLYGHGSEATAEPGSQSIRVLEHQLLERRRGRNPKRTARSRSGPKLFSGASSPFRVILPIAPGSREALLQVPSQSCKRGPWAAVNGKSGAAVPFGRRGSETQRKHRLDPSVFRSAEDGALGLDRIFARFMVSWLLKHGKSEASDRQKLPVTFCLTLSSQF